MSQSKVSFKFDGEGNKVHIVNILKSKLTNLKYTFETVSYNVFRVYVTAKESKEEVLKVCKAMQCFAILDNTKTL